MHELTLVSCIYQFSIAGGCAGTGICLFTSSGDNALTTMLIFGRNSASYCTHKAATAASCNRQMSEKNVKGSSMIVNQVISYSKTRHTVTWKRRETLAIPFGGY
jgi:hypothetical protein